MAVATACAATGTDGVSQTSSPTTVRPGPQTVCERFAIAFLAFDPRLDATPADARRRAARRYGTPALVAALNGNGDEPLWRTLTEHQAHVVVHTTPVYDDLPVREQNEVAVATRAARTAVGAAGWRQRLDPMIVFCTLRRRSGRWQVNDYTLAPSTIAQPPR